MLQKTIRLNPLRAGVLVLALLLVFLAILVACGGGGDSSQGGEDPIATPTLITATAKPEPTSTSIPATTEASTPVSPAPTPIPTAIPTVTAAPSPVPHTATPEPAETPTATPEPEEIPTATPEPEEVPPTTAIDGTGRKLLAIYMVGSDLEGDYWLGTTDLEELIDGFVSLSDPESIEVIVAFGGADKDGWRGMKFADIRQLMDDSLDLEFGNETGEGAYLYRDDYANMDYEGSLAEFLAYMRDGYVNFDSRFLTFWDHGGSYTGFGGDSNFPGDILTMDEIERAFRRSQPGVFDLIGFDACNMASIEVAKVIEANADYMLASQAIEPGHGWLWSEVVRHYAQQDDIVEAGVRMVDSFVQDEHVSPEESPRTLSLLDLSRYGSVVAALNPVVSTFGQQMRYNGQYAYSMYFAAEHSESYGKSEKEGSRISIDLTDFALLLESYLSDTELGPMLNDLLYEIDDFVVYYNHDGTMPYSYGVTVDAPENWNPVYSAYKINDTWLAFQESYDYWLQSDTEPPVAEVVYAEADGTIGVVYDESPVNVSILYGFEQDDYFMTVAELETYLTDVEGEYFAPAWDKWWFTVEYDPNEQTAWIPAYFDSWFEEDGREYTVYTSEIDFYLADESTPKSAVMTLISDEYMEIVDYYIQTYRYVYSSPDDIEGTLQFDKASYRILPGDAIQFWTYGYNLVDSSYDGWFEASDVATFVQEPIFHLELLEFEDEFGELIEYQYLMWAEDASGNGVFF